MSKSARLETAIQQALRRMRAAGCAFADVRFYADDDGEDLFLRDGNLEGNSSGYESGLGVRVLCDGAWGFAATAELDALPACFDRALANSRASARLPGFPKDPGAPRPTRGSYKSPVLRDPTEVPLAEKLDLLRQVDARLHAPHVAHRAVMLRFQRFHVFYWNSEGTAVERRQVNTFADMRVMATDAEGRLQRRSYSLNTSGHGTRGFEALADPAAFLERR